MEHISSQKGVHNEEKVKLCCKPSYQIRKLRNKGAIIILVWNFLAISTYSYLEKATNVPYAKHIGKQTFGFTLPLAGWLAEGDVLEHMDHVDRLNAGYSKLSSSSVSRELQPNPHYNLVCGCPGNHHRIGRIPSKFNWPRLSTTQVYSSQAY